MTIFPSIFAIVVGVGMVGMWSVSYFSNQIPELETEPLRIKFHLVGEFVTAISLLIAGIGMILNQDWARSVYLVAAGMLIYTVIVSPGYFAQRGQWAYIGMFAILLLLALACIFLVA